LALIAQVAGINCTRCSRVLFGPVTSAINAEISVLLLFFALFVVTSKQRNARLIAHSSIELK